MKRARKRVIRERSQISRVLVKRLVAIDLTRTLSKSSVFGSVATYGFQPSQPFLLIARHSCST